MKVYVCGFIKDKRRFIFTDDVYYDEEDAKKWVDKQWDEDYIASEWWKPTYKIIEVKGRESWETPKTMYVGFTIVKTTHLKRDFVSSLYKLYKKVDGEDAKAYRVYGDNYNHAFLILYTRDLCAINRKIPVVMRYAEGCDAFRLESICIWNKKGDIER